MGVFRAPPAGEAISGTVVWHADALEGREDPDSGRMLSRGFVK